MYSMTDSVGARLRQAREFRRLTLQQVSEATKVRTQYLQALESDDHSAIPSAAQARGFLRLYAEFLELDLQELVPPVADAAPANSPVPSVVAAPVTTPATSGLWGGLRRRLRRGASDTTPLEANLPHPVPLSDAASVSPDGNTGDVKKKAAE
jgi:transcriptional regulator with XRE-family HTH domain